VSQTQTLNFTQSQPINYKAKTNNGKNFKPTTNAVGHDQAENHVFTNEAQTKQHTTNQQHKITNTPFLNNNTTPCLRKKTVPVLLFE